MIEIGLPFSDPLADGPTIQDSSTQAIKNGMNSNVLFDQLKDIRSKVSIPLIVMGYFNPILQYGVEAFCKKCSEAGIDGLIIPDLPINYFELKYMIDGTESKHLNKIKPCVLTDFDVEFGGNGSFGMFASSGAPSVVNLSMTFQEVQLITRSDVKAGY